MQLHVFKRAVLSVCWTMGSICIQGERNKEIMPDFCVNPRTAMARWEATWNLCLLLKHHSSFILLQILFYAQTSIYWERGGRYN